MAAFFLALASCREPAGELRPGGRPVVATLGPGQEHRYRLPLQKGFLLRLVVDQQGIDTVVALEDPAGARALEVDRPIGAFGPELVLAVTDQTGDYHLVIGGAQQAGGYRAHIEALRPASAHDRLSAQAYRLFTRAKGQNEKEREPLMRQALATWEKLGEVALAAEALDSLARQQSDPQSAADLYRKAADAFERAGDRRWEAIDLTNLGAKLLDQGKTHEATDPYTRALRLAKVERDRRTQAKAFHGLGQIHRGQGELQQAVDDYTRALEFWPKDDGTRPATLHQLGVLYVHYLHEEAKGEDYLRQALKAWGEDSRSKALTLSQLGKLAYRQGRTDEARRSFEEALRLLSEKDPCSSAVVLMRLALVEEAQGAREASEKRKEEALSTLKKPKSCLKSEPTVHLLAGELAENRHDAAGAREAYGRCQSLFEKLGDRLGMAECLTGVARSEHLSGHTRAALQANRRALDILQEVRPTVLAEDLRLSFFAGAHAAFDLQIDLLHEMGDDEAAWATAEEARARALQDLLTEAGAGLRKDADPALVRRERAVEHELNTLQTQWNQATKDRPDLRRAIDAKISDLERLRGEIRRQNPRYASLTQPEPVTLARTRRELLDGETVLLEYRLEDQASTVWAVTRDAFAAVRLPPRDDLERSVNRAENAMHGLERRRRATPRAACDLSRKLLAPVAPFLAHRRVVVVADGALETLSFAALPVPPAGASEAWSCGKAPLLVDGHEIAYLPSVSALLTQRRLLAGRQPASKWLAVVADPLYRAARSRLPATEEEARAIAARVPAGKRLLATGPDASRQTVTGGALRDFRLLHFATHGTLDAEHPLLSALKLSDLDRAGQRTPGVLYAHEIYDLDLPAELVVLSACETGKGSDVPGEGLVSGLPRAFLYAGAARVIVSLWDVQDRSTRDLMKHFYQNLFDQHLPPARALQEAQRTLRQGGSRPDQWAGFVLLGDWQPLPPFSN